jgi:hypothetical protein
MKTGDDVSCFGIRSCKKETLRLNFCLLKEKKARNKKKRKKQGPRGRCKKERKAE